MEHIGTLPYLMNFNPQIIYILLHTGLACDHLAQLRRVIRRSPKKSHCLLQEKIIIFIDLKRLFHEMDLAFDDMHDWF